MRRIRYAISALLTVWLSMKTASELVAQTTKSAPRPDSARADSTRRAPSLLVPVRVRARRWKRPTVAQTMAGDPTGDERDGASLGVAMLDQGATSAVGATIAAFTLIGGANSGSLSAMGLPSAQTATTLNGVTFSGSELPRELFAPARAVTSTFDVSQGGFAGAQLALRTYSGSIFTNGSISTRLNAPLTSGAGAPTMTTPTVGLSGSRSGSALNGHIFYNAAASADRSSERAVTLRDVALDRVIAPGLSSNQAVATLRLLDSLGVPSPSSRTLSEIRTESASAFLRLDLAPNSVRSAYLVAYGSRNEIRPLPAAPLSSASLSGSRRTSTGGLLVEQSKLLRGRFLFFVRGGFTSRDAATEPTLALPQGRVLVPVGDGLDTGRTMITFGGTGTTAGTSATKRAELRPGLSWYSANGRHLIRLTSQLSHEWIRNSDPGNLHGSLFFASLDELRAGHPASFLREFGQREFKSATSNAGLSLGDQWRPNDALLLQYGFRLDGDRLGGSTRTNDAAGATEVDVRSWYLSPRIGFSWHLGSIKQAGYGPRPRGTLRGGIGAFRGVHAPSELRAPLLYSGGTNAVRQLECIGVASPAPNWNAWAQGVEIPHRCLDMVPGESDSTSSSTVQMNVVKLDRNFAPATSWRANVGWTGDIGFGLQLATDLTASRTFGLSGTRYVDQFGSPAFRIGGEDGRPVYADVSRIDERLGITPFGVMKQIATLHSDLHSRAVQMTAAVSPANLSPADRMLWSIGYAWTKAKNQSSGFDGSTAGDPRIVEWIPSPFAAQHRLTGFAALRLSNGAFLSIGAQWQSGLPFTPLVGGDINGDGLVNDRAFVTSAASHHACLRDQVGHIAAPGSCRGSAQASLNASVVIPGILLRLPARSTITVGLINPIVGVDQMLHGRNVKGWGQVGSPDPVLVNAVGFDNKNREFRYATNPAFGDVRRNALTQWQTSRVAIDIRLPLSRPQHEQLLHQVMAPGRERSGAKLTAEQVKQRYMSFGVINPVQALYRIRDSLRLTDKQRIGLDLAVRAFDARLDAIWTPIATNLAAVDRSYDRDTMLATIRRSQRCAWDALEEAVGAIRALLTSMQMEIVDPSIAALLDPGAIARLRRTEFRF